MSRNTRFSIKIKIVVLLFGFWLYLYYVCGVNKVNTPIKRKRMKIRKTPVRRLRKKKSNAGRPKLENKKVQMGGKVYQSSIDNCVGIAEKSGKSYNYIVDLAMAAFTLEQVPK